jgi:hypothetical protein
MAKHKFAAKTVAEILKGKRAAIKKAPLEEGSPSWADILHLTWEDIEAKHRDREQGFKTFHKLLKEKRFDK